MKNREQSRFIAAPLQRWPVWGFVLVAGAILPLFADEYVQRACSVFYLHLLLAAGLTMVVAYAGLLDLGYIAFFAIGAYSYALLNDVFGLPFFVALPVGGLLSALFGLVLGFPSLRVRGDYLALVTLGFGEIVRIILLNLWGPQGVAGIDPPLPAAVVGGVNNLYLLFYFVAFIPVPLALWFMSRLDTTRTARSWLAIRDNEIAANACGIESLKWLLLAFALGASFAGVAGVVFAGIQRYVSPGSFVLEESIFVLSIVVLAGGRSLGRLVLAAALLSFIPEILRDLADYRMLIYGCVLSSFVVLEELVKSRLPVGTARRAGTGTELSARPKVDRPPPEFLSVHRERAGWDLDVKDLFVRFGGITALDGLTLNVRLDGGIVGLIGPNGAGKTTLFNCIAGQIAPTSGAIRFPGASGRRAPSRSARAGIGRTFQTPQLFQTMTVRENIAIGAMLHHKKSDRGPEVDGILDYLGLSPAADSNVAALPLGLQRVTELGRALALLPSVILLDEVASGMNNEEKRQMAELLRRLSTDAGIGFLLVEHDMDFVLPLAREVLVLDRGRLIARGTPEDVRSDPCVVDAYLGMEHASA
jgi:branched-chain amino acid transport system permease protein